MGLLEPKSEKSMNAEYLLLCQGARQAKLHVELGVSNSLFKDPQHSTAASSFRRVVSLRVSGSKGVLKGVEVDGLSDLGRAAERLRGSLGL